jgi:hypothetical protein
MRPRRFELLVIPRTPAIDEAEAALANALAITVGGTRPMLSPEQVHDHLSRFFAIGEGEVQVKRYNRADFLLVFANRQLADRVLHAPPPPQAGISLSFRRWNRQAGALFKPFHFKILLSVTNAPTHMWSVETIQEIVGSSCLVSEVSPRSLDQSDLSRFLVVVWARHLDLIPTEVACSVPEPVDPFVNAQPPLFLTAHEIIHSKCNLLHFRAFVHIVEVHDFNLLESSDNDDRRPPSSDSSDDEYPGFDHGQGNLRPWPKVSRFVSDNGSTSSSWPLLPSADDKVWSSPSPAAGRPAASLMGGLNARNLPTWGAVPEKVTVHDNRKQGGGRPPMHSELVIDSADMPTRGRLLLYRSWHGLTPR